MFCRKIAWGISCGVCVESGLENPVKCATGDDHSSRAHSTS